MNLADLSTPLEIHQIDFRVQSINRGGYATILAYKDARVDMPKATVEFCELGAGDMVPYLEPLAARLEQDGYDGVISLESVYRPDDGDFEAGYRASLPAFKQLFA